ncbi:MAG: beta-lactamase family protein [Proteobacteria bacterium]|nr:beta-lactamase family protein [Pseudomonadota bacterium]
MVRHAGVQVALDAAVPLPLGMGRQFVAPVGSEIELANEGDGDLTVAILRPGAGLGWSGPELPLLLTPGSRAMVGVGASGEVLGPVEANLEIDSNDPLTPTASIAWQGRLDPYIQVLHKDNAAVSGYARQIMRAEQLVGLGIGIVEGLDIVYLQGFGFADRAANVKVDPSATLFRWASLSKGVIGLAAMQAVTRREIQLDASISDYFLTYMTPRHYLPGGCGSRSCQRKIPEDKRVITLRQLLSHTAGATHYSNGIGDPKPPQAMADDPMTNTGIEWALRYWIDQPLVAIPETMYSYSTFGYNLAGVVVEHGAARKLADLVHDWISVPLGMSTMQPDYFWVDLPNRAVGYTGGGDPPIPDGDNDVSWKLPGGGFISTVGDLARYCAGLMGKVVLDPAVRDGELWKVQPPATSYALGFRVGSSPNGERIIYHTGSQQKTKTALRAYPDQQRCFVVMTNSTWVSPIEILDGADMAYGR